MSESPRELGNELHATIRRFKIKTGQTLAAGGSCTVYWVLFRNGSRTDTTTEGTVYDAEGIFEGTENKRGKAVFMPDSGHWEIIQLECP